MLITLYINIITYSLMYMQWRKLELQEIELETLKLIWGSKIYIFAYKCLQFNIGTI